MSLAEDRRELTSLHGLSVFSSASSNPVSEAQRNAPSGDGRIQVYWKNDATIIKTPAEKAKMEKPTNKLFGQNPYNFNSKRSLSTKDQVIAPSKSRKINLNSTPSSSTRSKHFAESNGKEVHGVDFNIELGRSVYDNSTRHSTGPLHTFPPEEEDVGVPVSLQNGSLYGVNERDRSSDRDPLDLIQVGSSVRNREIAKDGASTQRLREKQSNAVAGPSSDVQKEVIDVEDDIEEADRQSPTTEYLRKKGRRASTPSGKTSFRPDNVRNMVEKFGGRPFKDPPPRMDLKAKQRIGQSRLSNMKGKDKGKSKQPYLGPPPLQMRDARIPPSTQFTGDNLFRLSHCIVGGNLLESKEKDSLYLKWDREHMLSLARDQGERTQNLLDVDLFEYNVTMLKYSNDKSIIAIELSHRTASHKGELVFKFVSDPRILQHYDDLVVNLKGKCKEHEMLDKYGTKTVWEAYQREVASFGKDPDIVDGNSTSKDYQQRDNFTTKTRLKLRSTTIHDLSQRRQSPSSVEPRSIPQPVRRSSRQASAHVPSPGSDEIVLVYPPSGAGAVNISGSDVCRLKPGEYLNDTLIELGLKFWMHDLRQDNPALAENIHVFNSFFYKKLNVKNISEGYQSIRKWTLKFDIFKKKYIIVPINEHMHWYLAIICYPEHILQAPQAAPEKMATRAARRKSGEELAADKNELKGQSSGSDVPPSFLDKSDDSNDAVEQIIKPTRECSIGDVNYSNPTLMDVDGNEDKRPAVDDSVSECTSWGGMEGGGPPSDSVIPDSDAEGTVATVDEVDQLQDDDDNYERREHRQDDATNRGDMGLLMEVDTPTGKRYFTGTALSANLSNKEEEKDMKAPQPAIAAAAFYTSKSNDGENLNHRASPTQVSEDVADDEAVVDESSFSDGMSTYILTLDSLGSRHPQAIKVLKSYLQFEAKDKKNIEASNTAMGKTVSVPTQPNYCDCGIYLLHFVRVFMEDPEKMVQTICSQSSKRTTDNTARATQWRAHKVDSLRQVLLQRIQDESENWKAEKARKDEEKAGATNTANKTEAKSTQETDDEIIVQETIPKSPVAKGGKGRKSSDLGTKGQGYQQSLRAAARLRG